MRTSRTIGRHGVALVTARCGAWSAALASSLVVGLTPVAATDFNAETRTRQQLVQVALAREPADLVLHGATVLNVVTGDWEKNQDIVIRGERIAWVGKAGSWTGKASHEVDARGEWAVPGFGEAHKHIESTYLTPEYEATLVVPR
ncbi:MAG: Adenine deaminase, partial [Gammaproteobacteria bacterium]|nr:Adenine deaminase [Gammaproteobacteria bacterium]